MASTFSLHTPEASLVYDVRGALSPAAGLPPLTLLLAMLPDADRAFAPTSTSSEP